MHSLFKTNKSSGIALIGLAVALFIWDYIKLGSYNINDIGSWPGVNGKGYLPPFIGSIALTTLGILLVFKSEKSTSSKKSVPQRRIGFLKTLLVSLLLTPVIILGLFILMYLSFFIMHLLSSN